MPHRTISILIGSLSLLALGCANNAPMPDQQPPRAEAPSKDAWVYMIRLSRPDMFETATKAEQEMFAGHFAYLQDLTRRGVVVVAGPCTDMIGPGIVIFEAPNEDAAREVMLGDPGVAGGVFIAELHPMRLSLLRERDMSAR